MAWESSDRRARLPAAWPALVARTRELAGGLCEARTHADGCSGLGSECDHITPGDDHRQANLQWLSTPCHTAKTTREAAQARARTAELRQLPREAHPSGLRPRRP